MNIRQKIVIALMCVSLPALMALGGFGYWRAQSSIELSRTLSLEAIAASRVARLDNLLRDWQENLRTVAADRLLTDTVQEYNRTSDTRFREPLARILDRAVGTSGIRFLQLHDRNGAVVATAGNPIGRPMPAFRSGAEGHVEVLRITAGSEGQAPLVVMQAPVRVAQSDTAYIIAEISARGLQDVVRDRHGLGHSGQLQVWWTGDGGSGEPVAGVRSTTLPLPVAVDRANGQVRRVHHADAEWLIASLRARNKQLVVTVSLNANEALHHAHQFRTALLGFGIGLIVLVLLAGFWVGGRLSAGVRALSDVAVMIRHGQLQRRAPAQGTDEVAVLGRAFNEMAETLITANSELERRVQARTEELAQANAALEQRNAELARSNTDLVAFASVASHDLQEPLRKVQAFGDRLADRCAHSLDERGQDYVQRMRQSAARMRTLINDLLAFSQVQSQSQAYSEVDLTAVMKEVRFDLEEELRASAGTVEVTELPTIAADYTQMLQLFQNLIGNALKYAKPDEAPIVKIGATTHEDCVSIKFTDNGIGFEPRYADRIFGIFQRLHARDVYQGTGLGLAICKRIMERHHGTIVAEGLPGFGATFTVTLPLGRKGEDSVEEVGPTLAAVGGD